MTKEQLDERLQVLADSYQKAQAQLQQAQEIVLMHRGAIGEINTLLADIAKEDAKPKLVKPKRKASPAQEELIDA